MFLFRILGRTATVLGCVQTNSIKAGLSRAELALCFMLVLFLLVSGRLCVCTAPRYESGHTDRNNTNINHRASSAPLCCCLSARGLRQDYIILRRCFFYFNPLRHEIFFPSKFEISLNIGYYRLPTNGRGAHKIFFHAIHIPSYFEIGILAKLNRFAFLQVIHRSLIHLKLKSS